MRRVTGRHGATTEDRGVRLAGVALYAVIVAVAWWLLPSAMPFVGPAAAFGVAMHAGGGRPWLGFAGFWVLLVVIPALFFPSMLTDAFGG